MHSPSPDKVNLAGCVFIGPSEYISSYSLIELAKFVLVYNSSVGLEATLLGVPVLCAGRARFTQWPTVTFPEDRPAYERTLQAFLEMPTIAFDEA